MISRTRDRIAAGLFALAIVLSLTLAASGAVPFPSRAFLYDYRAFACAGKIAGTAADPYLAEPLRSCEHRSGLLAGRSDLALLAVPAPLPGYALAPFALLGRLPSALGATLWLLISLFGAVVAVRALIAIARIRARFVLLALGLPLALALVLGQLVPLALGALCFGALALERGNYRLAAIAIWCAMIEPHVALPALIALLVFVPRARLVAAGGAILALVLSVALLGISKNLEYLAGVLPAHALSELANEEQYSLAYWLHLAGAGDALALRLADAWYLVTLVAGLFLAQRLVARGGPRSLYVLIPAALAVVGAPFVHVQQMVFALPAILVLSGRIAPRARALPVAIVLLSVPWGAFALLTIAMPLVAFTIGMLTYELLGARPLVATLSGLLAAAFIDVLAQSLFPRPDATTALAPFGDGRLLAEASWTAYIRSSFHQNVVVFGLAKIPTLVGLAFGITLVVRAALRERPPLGAAHNPAPA